MTTPPDDTLRTFRAFTDLVMKIHPRDELWTQPLRVMHATTNVFDGASPAVREALTLLMPGFGQGRVPGWLVAATWKHIARFDELYALSRTSWMFAFPFLERLVKRRWPILAQELLKRGVDNEAVQQMDRYLAVRFNALIGVDKRLSLRALPVVAASTPEIRQTALNLFNEVERYAKRALREGQSLDALRKVPFQKLDPFGKLLRLMPVNDPGWQQLAALAVERAGKNAKLPGNHMQGLLGEIIAARTPGVLAFFQQETAKILSSHPELLQQGWRPVFQSNSVMMAKRAKAFEAGGKLGRQGPRDSGLSFDLSVWLVNEETDQAMVMVRGQVKAGTEETVMSGTKQTKADDWRMFSGSVTLQLDGRAKNFDLRPPDVFTDIKVLVGANLPEAERLAEAVTPGSLLHVFKLPLTGGEFGMLGNILAKVALQ